MHRNLFIYRHTALPTVSNAAYLESPDLAASLFSRIPSSNPSEPGLDPICISFDRPTESLTPEHIRGRGRNMTNYTALSVMSPAVFDKLKNNILVTVEGEASESTEICTLEQAVDSLETNNDLKIVGLDLKKGSDKPYWDLFFQSMVLLSAREGKEFKPFHVGQEATRTIQKVLGRSGRYKELALIHSYLQEVKRDEDILFYASTEDENKSTRLMREYACRK